MNPDRVIRTPKLAVDYPLFQVYYACIIIVAFIRTFKSINTIFRISGWYRPTNINVYGKYSF